MKIVTWNCRRGPLRDKRKAVEELGPDIVVMTEAPRPTPSDDDVLWFGEGKNGVAVFARAPYLVSTAPRNPELPCVYPVFVSGPVNFTLLAVWTWQAPTYHGALLNGLQEYRALPQPWVVAGDFNGNVKFDGPRAKQKWRYCFDQLEQHGLTSAYHEHTRAEHGKEPHPTHYFLTRRERPFHIDFCFIPRRWAQTITSVHISSFDEFRTLSDHRPLSVELHPN